MPEVNVREYGAGLWAVDKVAVVKYDDGMGLPAARLLV